jgi:hypothetical protein
MGDITISLAIDNTYEDGTTIPTVATDVVVPPPPTDRDSGAWVDWSYDHIFERTGTGRTDGDSWYDVKVTASSNPDLIPVGLTFEFGY